jgi:hypothetical protein
MDVFMREDYSLWIEGEQSVHIHRLPNTADGRDSRLRGWTI